MTSKTTSIPRRHFLWVVLVLLVGWRVSTYINSEGGKTISHSEWASFASVVSGASASMVGLTIALAAILYALLGTPLIKFMHERGSLNRVLFDLMVGAAIWLIALVCSIVSAHPGVENYELLMKFATTFSIAGSLHFVVIGWAFWLLLRNAGVQPTARNMHDFREPTKLD